MTKKEWYRQWYKKNRARKIAQVREWQSNNRDKTRAYSKTWYDNNTDYHRQHYLDKKNQAA